MQRPVDPLIRKEEMWAGIRPAAKKVMRIFKKAGIWAFCACLVCTLSSATFTGCGKANDSRKTETSVEETIDINVILITNVLECSNEDGEKIWEALKAEGAKEIDMIGIDGKTLYITDVDGTEYVVELFDSNEVMSSKKR